MTPETEALILIEQRRILRGLPGEGALTTANVVPTPGAGEGPFVAPVVSKVTGVAVGSGSKAQGDFAVAVGAFADAKVGNATAIGAGAVAHTKSSIALGNGNAQGEGAIAIGDASTVTGEQGFAAGPAARSPGDRGVAVGRSALAAGNDSIAMGNTANANFEGSIAIGQSATANEVTALAIGDSAMATEEDAIAIGYIAEASGPDSVAIGAETRATRGQSVALGNGARTDKPRQVSVGREAEPELAEFTRLLSHVSDPEADTDAVNKRWALANLGGGGGGNPNQIAKVFNLVGATPVEVLRIPCPEGMGWNFSLSLGAADINGTPAVLQGGTGAFFNEGGTFVYDGDWDYHWAVEAPSPFRFGTMDLSTDPVVDGAFMRAAQVGNELVITCEPDNALAVGPCAILFEGTRSDGSGFAPPAPAPIAALNTLAVASLTTPYNIPDAPSAGFAQVPLDTADENDGNHFSVGTGRYTVPATGFYLITASAGLTNSAGSFIEVRRNGEVIHAIIDPGASDSPNGNFTFLARLTAGDQIGLFISWPFVTASATVNGIEAGKGSTSLNIVQLVDSAAGAVPDDMAKMLQTLQVGMPNWFKAPDLANSGLDVLASSGRNVNVALSWLLQPWSSATVFWGDGQQSSILMDGQNNPKPQGGQSAIGFGALSDVAHTYAADGTYNLQLVVQNPYGQDIYEETFVFEPV